MPDIPSAVSISPALPVGTMLGNYILLKVIGNGGFGITYLAQEEITKKLVVIKENYPAEVSFRDMASLTVGPSGESRNEAYEWALKRFLDEAKTLARLSHPNIVNVLTAFKALGTAYYVMPHVEGTELHIAAPAPDNINAEWLLPVLKKILNALDYLHAEGLIHRDIKHSNILLNAAGEPILIDFGTARALESTHSHTHIGTPGFMPLEQFSAKGKRGPWTDFYALGATCYRLITGEIPPHSVDRLVEDEYLPLSEIPSLGKRFPMHVLKSIDKALRLNINERYQSAQEWLNALKGILSSPTGKTSPDIKLKPDTAPKSHPASSKKRSKLHLILASLLIFAVLGCGVFFYPNIKQPHVERIPDDGNISLYTAAQNGDAEKVHLCLNAGADGNWTNEAESKNTPLHMAATNGHADCVRLLLAAPGSDVNRANENGETPLNMAAARGHEECVNLLLAAPGSDVNKANENGETPLIIASKQGHTECVRTLLTAPGIDVNKANMSGNTPLALAATNGHTECVRTLLAAPGIEVNSEDKDSQTPLHWAENNNHTECADLIRAAGGKSRRAAILLEQMGISPEQYNSSLYAAVRDRETEKISLLLAAGADANWANEDENGTTPLVLAAQKGHTECVRLLLAAPGIDVNKANKDGTTPLSWAAQKGHTENVSLLLAAPGININQVDSKGITPLFWAASWNHTECVRLLLAAPGIDINLADTTGLTPFICAAGHGHTECVSLLLNAPGIDVNQTSQKGNTALCLATYYNRTECVNLLLNTPGIDVNMGIPNGDTPLMIAACNGHTECLRLLLSAPGIDVNKAEKNGITPLICAAAMNQTECVRILLNEPKLDVNKANRDGDTPLFWAASRGHTECVRTLLAAPRINVNKANKNNTTPLSAATANGHTECANLIRAAGGRR